MLLATAWGPKFGGINAFNMDFAKGLASYLAGSGRVFCAVFNPTGDDRRAAADYDVTLVDIDRPIDSPGYDRSWSYDVWTSFKRKEPDTLIDWWVGHDVITGEAAAEGPTVARHGRSALIMHMNYQDYQAYKSGIGIKAEKKTKQQRSLFKVADRHFANGPLLRDALQDILPSNKGVTMLVPGFAAVPVDPPDHRLSLITFGRMDRENDRIKQGALAVAGFASAVRESHERSGGPSSLKENPRFRLIGITEPGGDDEEALRKLAADRAGRQVNLLPLPFDEAREEVLAELGRANLALMLSWHEGFGLTGWEAIAGEVPLILSLQSGLWKLLQESFGQLANGLVKTVDVRGREGSDEASNFRAEDEEDVKNVILDVAADPASARKAAVELKQKLAEKLVCTWENTARQFVDGLGGQVSEDRESKARSAEPVPIATKTHIITIPTTVWPGTLSERMPASLMLRPESGIVPFHRSRHRARDAIIDWALEPERPLKLLLQTGEGGSGKTRLLIEVCERLVQAHDWRAGFLGASGATPGELQQLFHDGKPCLIVLDYAETRSDQIVKLAATALHSGADSRVRFVLLARDGGDWWNRLAEAKSIDNATAAILRDPGTTSGPHVLAKDAIAISDREELYGEALACFARAMGREQPATAAVDLTHDQFAKPLFIHLAALSALQSESNQAAGELLGAVLGHERAYWRQLLAESGLGEELEAPLEQAVALLSLVGGTRSASEAKQLLERTPRLHRHTAEQRDMLFDALRRLFAFEGGLAGLEPDLLGETLVEAAVARDDELLDAALGEDATSSQARQALTVLTRLARRVPATKAILKRALSRHLGRRASDARQVGEETGAPLPEILATVLREAPLQEQRKVVNALRPHMPKDSSNLGVLSVEVASQVVAFAERQKSGNPRKRDRRQFEAFSGLAIALQSRGQHSEAADFAERALNAAQRAFRGKESSKRGELATWMNNYAGILRNVGRYAESLERAKAAEAIWRELAKSQPDAYRAVWATSLANLGNCYHDVGRYVEALDRAETAEAIRRGLAESQPDAYRADWATSLGNLGGHYSDVGRYAEALERAEAAEALWRELAKSQPDAHR
ncbi:MAG: tetratricopeptide repeat protein, partial [Pseudomonadota bacterium]